MIRFLCVLVLAGTASAAFATVFPPVSADQLFRESDLVFEGRVSGVEYRLSTKAARGDAEVPHTFVTFDIVNIFRGSVENSKKLTLRFLGGMRKNGRLLLVSGTPLFQVGDHDVLFVKRNDMRACPIVHGESGRFRIVDDRVFFGTAEDVWLLGDQLLRGAPSNLASLTTFHLTPKRSIRFESTPSDVGRANGPEQSRTGMPAQAVRADYKSLIRYIETVAQRTSLPEPAMTRSAEPDRSFSFRLSRPSPPPSVEEQR